MTPVSLSSRSPQRTPLIPISLPLAAVFVINLDTTIVNIGRSFANEWCQQLGSDSTAAAGS